MKAALLSLCLLPSLAAQADEGLPAFGYVNFARLQAAQAAIPHDAPAGTPPGFACAPDGAGRRCRGRLPGNVYPKEIVLFYASWPPPPRPELILYLHGFNQSFDDVLAHFDFGRLLAASGRTGAVLIVPDGTGASKDGYYDQTYRTQFQAGPGAAKRFQRFVAALAAAVGGEVAAERPLVLAGHSGAGGTALYPILDCSRDAICWKNSRELYLLDAAYDSAALPTYARFAAAPEHRFLSVFYDTGKHNAEIWRMIDPSRKPSDFKPLSGNVDEKILRGLTTAFVAADVDHMGTVAKYLPEFLAPR